MLVLFAAAAMCLSGGAPEARDGGTSVKRLQVSAATVGALPEKLRKVFFEAFEGSGTRARLQGAGLTEEVGVVPGREGWNAALVFRVQRPEGETWAEVAYFRKWETCSETFSKLLDEQEKAGETANTSVSRNGAFVVVAHANGADAARTVADIAERVTGYE